MLLPFLIRSLQDLLMPSDLLRKTRDLQSVPKLILWKTQKLSTNKHNTLQCRCNWDVAISSYSLLTSDCSQAFSLTSCAPSYVSSEAEFSSSSLSLPWDGSHLGALKRNSVHGSQRLFMCLQASALLVHVLSLHFCDSPAWQIILSRNWSCA